MLDGCGLTGNQQMSHVGGLSIHLLFDFTTAAGRLEAARGGEDDSASESYRGGLLERLAGAGLTEGDEAPSSFHALPCTPGGAGGGTDGARGIGSAAGAAFALGVKPD